MELDDYIKTTGNFLKADDIKKNPTASFVISNEGTLVESEKFGNMRLHIEGNFGGEPKIFDCAKTNARTIAEKLGNDSKKWLGHLLTFETYKTKTSDGKLVDAITIKTIQ